MIRRVLERSVFNPLSWLAWAAVMAAAWGVCHALGWRADTAVLSGTVDPSHGSATWVMFRGMIYAVTYFAAMVVGPVLVLASGVFVVLVRVTGGAGKAGAPQMAEHNASRIGEPPEGGMARDGAANGQIASGQVVNSRDL